MTPFSAQPSPLLRALLVPIVALLALAVGCGEPIAAPTAHTFDGDPPVRITVTVGMLGDLVRAIGGDRVEVTDLMGPGTDPHTYASTPKDTRQLEESHLILYVGHHLEGRLGQVLGSIGRRVPTFAAGEAIPTSRLLAADDDAAAHDPHLWFDVALWGEVAEAVATELARFDPAGADHYAARAATLDRELSALDSWVREQISALPENRRVLVTAHDAFRYFGRAYGIRVEGIQGISTEDEAGLQRINELVDFLVKEEIPAVFVESTVAPKNVRALVEGCRRRGHTLVIGGSLYSDAMGPRGESAGEYFGMIRHNVTTIVNALR